MAGQLSPAGIRDRLAPGSVDRPATPTPTPSIIDYLTAIACHETGHTVGLLHGDNAIPTVPNQTGSLMCMKKTVSSADYPLGSHNAAQIDTVY